MLKAGSVSALSLLRSRADPGLLGLGAEWLHRDWKTP